jgi:hypothetical protein
LRSAVCERATACDVGEEAGLPLHAAALLRARAALSRHLAVPWDRRINAVGKGHAVAKPKAFKRGVAQIRALHRIREFVDKGEKPPDAVVGQLYRVLYGGEDPQRAFDPWTLLVHHQYARECFWGAYVDEDGIVRELVGFVVVGTAEARKLREWVPRGQKLVALDPSTRNAKAGDRVVLERKWVPCRWLAKRP